MRIVHLTSSLQVGGVEMLICLLAEEGANDKDNQISVVIINNDSDDFMLERLYRTGVTVFNLKRKRGNILNIPWYMLKLRRYLLLSGAKVLHVHNRFSMLIGYLSTLFLSIKRVYTLHAIKLYSNMLGDILLKHFAVILSHKIIAISQAVKKDFIQGMEVPQARISVVPNGIRISEFHPQENMNNILKIICVGRLDHLKKGQDILIHALSLLKEQGIQFHCDLVGDGPSRKLLEDMITMNDLWDYVRLQGTRLDIPELLRSSDLFVLPSRFEGFGIVIIEAMASGVPVLASDIDSPKEIIKHGVNGYLFRSDDESDLANKIKELMRDHSKRSDLAKKGLDTAKRYSISRMYREYKEQYEAICNE